LFIIAPLVYGLRVSFQHWSVMDAPRYIGLRNFIQVLNDSRFWQVVSNTLVFAAIKVPIAVVVPLLLALILHRQFPGRLWPLVAFVSPNFFASAGLMLVWYWMLDTRVGLVNYYLRLFGVLKEPVSWFANANTAWMWIITITVWWISGFFVLLYLSALQKIPPEQYEAAMIDGGGSWTKFVHVTLPWLRNVMFFIVAYQVILAFGLFDQVYFLTEGGPVGRTRTIVYYIYMTGFQRQQFGRAAAISWLMFVLVIAFGIFQLLLLTRSIRSAEE